MPISATKHDDAGFEQIKISAQCLNTTVSYHTNIKKVAQPDREWQWLTV